LHLQKLKSNQSKKLWVQLLHKMRHGMLLVDRQLFCSLIILPILSKQQKAMPVLARFMLGLH